ncbi:tyrosine-type recombinase/integrase [Zhouia sp. PK063]|uniref:tyrosine-type recombinase/integrase n=1 Tax=Zhouia sp. PK063 TaxID=3373602 RepID=UPI00379AF777
MATKVTLRQKPMIQGRKSLYLDFYPPIVNTKNGKSTRREFLKLYIEDKPKTPLDKQGKKQTLLLAEQIRQKREYELNKPEIYSAFEKEKLEQKEKGELSFIQYFEILMDKKEGNNYNIWATSLTYLKDFANNDIKFKDLDEKFCNDYRDFLLTVKSKRSNKSKLSQNTALSYFNKFKAALKRAFKDDIISKDLSGKIEPIKSLETNRVFLTLEELNRLVKAECPNKILKQASLFSALTGMRFSDIQKLTWNEVIEDSTNGYSIYFKQKKTKNHEYLPISDQAYSLLGFRENGDNKVFKNLHYSAHYNHQLLKWVINAEISKHITFHSFRHTYATLQLQAGTDIYTVSKMLGHKELKTTQVYAKIVDETKRKAASKINIDLL